MYRLWYQQHRSTEILGSIKVIEGTSAIMPRLCGNTMMAAAAAAAMTTTDNDHHHHHYYHFKALCP